jgi:hypothetical protein
MAVVHIPLEFQRINLRVKKIRNAHPNMVLMRYLS